MGCETEAGGAAVMWGLFRTAEVETELSHKEKLSIYPSASPTVRSFG